MAIVKEWGGAKVPEGFTYYMNGNFYNMEGTSPVCRKMKSIISYYSTYSFDFIKANGVKLPEEVELPEVKQDTSKPEIDWSSAPSDSAVWVVDHNSSAGHDFSGWYHDLNSQNRYIGFEGGHLSCANEGVKFTVYRPVKTITTEVAEWKLVAGGECQILNTQLHNAAYENCVINFIGSYVFVYTSDSCEERFGHVETCKFRPIKTQEEKERDELKDFLLQHQPSADSSMSQIDIIEQYMTNLMLAGARTPKGGES
tara:strand:- start:679 stop:1443 length:765 start_codon:yes stop_codon:yes gene_type:complete